MSYSFNPFTGNFDSSIPSSKLADLIFTDASVRTISAEDLGKFICVEGSNDHFIVIPANSNFEDGFQVSVARIGSGFVEISASQGVNLRSAEGRTLLRVQNSTAALVKLSAEDWLAFGDLFNEET